MQRVRTFSLYSVLAVLLCLPGCNGDSDGKTNVAPVVKPVNQETENEKCRRRLADAIRPLNPESLSLHANPERAINGLNAWIASCAADELATLNVSEATLKMVNSNPRTTSGRFTANDSVYVRDCILLRDLSTSIWERIPADKEGIGLDASRVQELFDWTVRNVSLLADSEKRVSLGLFDILLTGRGTARDRAWIFVEALRQQHIHTAFVVSTDSPPDGESSLLDTADWLVLVALENGNMVLDVAFGMPVTSGDTDVPASLNDLKTHARWKESRLNIVAQHATFSSRMFVLQNQLSAQDSAVFFEELAGGVSEITSLIDLATTTGDGLWKAENISVWNYPEEQTVSAFSLSEADTTTYQRLMRSFDAPFERKVVQSENFQELTTVPEELTPEQRNDFVQQRLMEEFERMSQSSEEMFGKPSRKLLKARVRQIMGSADTSVIQQLQQVRIASMQERIRLAVPQAIQQLRGWPPVLEIDFPDLIREVNQSSTGNALYWTAMCQIDRGEFGTAIITLLNYRRQYPNGVWTYPSMMNQAIALLKQERLEDARAILTEANVPENPEQQRVAMMLEKLSE